MCLRQAWTSTGFHIPIARGGLGRMAALDTHIVLGRQADNLFKTGTLPLAAAAFIALALRCSPPVASQRQFAARERPSNRRCLIRSIAPCVRAQAESALSAN